MEYKINKYSVVLVLTHIFMIAFLMVVGILGFFYPDAKFGNTPIFKSNLFGWECNLAVVMLFMCIFEFISTFTFQLRMKLTAKFENDKNEKLIWMVPLIAGLSWIVAGTQGIFLIGDSDNLIKSILKMVPVFIATFNGVYIIMISKKNKADA